MTHSMWILALVFGAGVLAVALWYSRSGNPFARTLDLTSARELLRQYLSERRYMEAMVVAKKALKAAPGDPLAVMALAEVYIAQGKPARAISLLEDLLKRLPAYSPARELLDQLRRGA
jgi:predicted Zn-dependent protease